MNLKRKCLKKNPNKARLSQSDFIRKLINDYANNNSKNDTEQREKLLKIIEDLTLLKQQMDFLNYRDYSNFIIKQINQIRNILNIN